MLQPMFLKACCWQVLHSFWPYCCQESSSLPSTLPFPLRSMGFRTLDLWWATGSKDRQWCQLSTSTWSILKNPVTSKWSSHHPCPSLMCSGGKNILSLSTRGLLKTFLFCKAPIHPPKASPSLCDAEHGPYYPTSTENMGTWWLLSQQKVHDFQVNTNKLLMLIITNFLHPILYRCILLLQSSRVSDGYRGKLVAVV